MSGSQVYGIILPDKNLWSEVYGLRIRPEESTFSSKIRPTLLYLLQSGLYQNSQVSLLVKNSLVIDEMNFTISVTTEPLMVARLFIGLYRCHPVKHFIIKVDTEKGGYQGEVNFISQNLPRINYLQLTSYLKRSMIRGYLYRKKPPQRGGLII